MARCDVNFPSYWNRRPWNNGQSFRLLDADSKVTSAITKTIVQNFDPDLVGKGSDARDLSHGGIEVVSVQRLESPWLFGDYFQERRKLFARCSATRQWCLDIQKLPGSRGRVNSTKTMPHFMKQELYWQVNEHYLFHGTKPENIESILSRGLDPASSNPNQLFGKAVYTSESFTKADQYTDLKDARSQPGDDLYMILARVLLGNVFLCADETQKQNLISYCHGDPSSYSFPPTYDSVMGDGHWMFRVFAVNYKNRCYPEYVIKYRRKERHVLGGTAEEREMEEAEREG